MPEKKYELLYVRREDYDFFEDFAKKLSAAMGTDLKIPQALKMAVTQYEVKNKMENTLKEQHAGN